MEPTRIRLPAAVYFFIAIVLVCLIFSCNNEPAFRSVLVFSKTEGYRHASIEEGKQMFLQLGEKHGFKVDTSEDASVFNEESLNNYNLVVFLSTTGDILDPDQQRELERFMKAGGNWMGIHAAADTEYSWPWYNQLCGAYFLSHPEQQEATMHILETNHQSVAHLKDTWTRFDEWYNYKDIVEETTPVLRVDESTYDGGENGEFHPIAWYRDFENGRSFYTGVGHTSESYTDPDFIAHILGGMEYAWGESKPVNYQGVSSTPEENRFQIDALVTGMREPMELDILPDGRPIWIERGGRIKLYDEDFDLALMVGDLDVWTEHEDGLLGLAVDPQFEENNWLYLYYSPPGEESVNRLSRFKFVDDKFQRDSEQVILDVPVARNECCHSAGSIEFSGDGLLHLSIGDNTNPFKSDGFAPIDDSADQPNFDARRSSANTKDLRGGIVRIRVEEDGAYSIPTGNLFTDPEVGRPEIFAMGMRNPFRIHVDQRNGNVYWGDVGPDAQADSAGLGPRGYDEVNVATEAGFFGWPLFIGDNFAYHERNFKTGGVGEAFDPAAPINDSRLNTGARKLPPAQPAMIYYPYAKSEEHPLLGDGGRNAMAGPVFYRDDYTTSDYRFPEYYDEKFFFYDWMRDRIMAAELDEEGYVADYEPFLPNAILLHPIDMLFGEGGDLYIIEYGTKWFSRNNDARLLRIRYNPGNRAPVADFDLANSIGAVPFTLSANASRSLDYDGDEMTYTWMLDDEEIGTGPNLEYTVNTPGISSLRLAVNDGRGSVGEKEVQLLLGNSLPLVSLEVKGNRTFFFEGQPLPYTVTASDLEDGDVSPAEIVVTFDYLEGEDKVMVEAGHQVAGQNAAYAEGKFLMEESDCAGCHQLTGDSNGPALIKVAERYRKQDGAAEYLAGKIIAGGGGVWGERVMAAHPDIPESDAEAMAEYILSLAGPLPGLESLASKGTLVFDEHRTSVPGRYILQASYTDKGGGDGLPRLTSREVVTLRSPVLAADRYNSGNKVMPYHVKAEDNPISDESADVLVASSGGWSGYGEVDFTGVSSIKVQYGLVPGVTSGGTIRVLIDDPNAGNEVGSAVIEQGLTSVGLYDVSIPLPADLEGIHKVYFRYRADSDSPDAVLAAIASYEFVAEEGSK